MKIINYKWYLLGLFAFVIQSYFLLVLKIRFLDYFTIQLGTIVYGFCLYMGREKAK